MEFGVCFQVWLEAVDGRRSAPVLTSARSTPSVSQRHTPLSLCPPRRRNGPLHWNHLRHCGASLSVCGYHIVDRLAQRGDQGPEQSVPFFSSHRSRNMKGAN